MPGEHISKQNDEKQGAAAARLPLFSGLFDVGQAGFYPPTLPRRSPGTGRRRVPLCGGVVCSNPALWGKSKNAQQRLLPLLSVSVSIGQAGFYPPTLPRRSPGTGRRRVPLCGGVVCSNPALWGKCKNAQQRLLPLLSVSVSIGQGRFGRSIINELRNLGG